MAFLTLEIAATLWSADSVCLSLRKYIERTFRPSGFNFHPNACEATSARERVSRRIAQSVT